MGSAVFEIGDILGSRGSTKAKKLKKGGTLYARIQKAAPRPAGKLALRMRGIKLKNVEGMFKKSDPFYELRRTYDGPGGGSWTPVYRSKHVKNNLNPKWEPATIDVNTLCDGDLDRRLQVAIFDHEGSGKHETMGTFETTSEFARVDLYRNLERYCAHIITYFAVSHTMKISQRIAEGSGEEHVYSKKRV